MKYFLSLCGLVVLVLSARAALSPWAAEVRAATPLENALFRVMALPDGPVLHVRPPEESRAELTSLIKANASPLLYAVRAREEERAGDYAAAEADWKQAPASELAEYYERRLEPEKEITALLKINAYERAITVAQQALLSPAPIYEAWIKYAPKALSPYQGYLAWAMNSKNAAVASRVAERLKAAFPADVQLAVTTDATVAGAGALAVYARNFSPLWPENLRHRYFGELAKAHQLRTFLGDAQRAAAARPDDLRPVSQIFFYYEEEKRKPAADAELLRFVSRRANWTAEEEKTIAELFLRVQNYDEAARFYSLLGGESGLASIVALLLEVPEQPLRFANRDLSLYKNIAGMDRHPGFLNGILTVALNTTDPEGQYTNASQTAVAYFHRAAASRLLDQLKGQFPNAPSIPNLEAQLFNAYALYGQDEALLRDVPPWLLRNTNAEGYVPTAMSLADAYGRTSRIADELSLYDRLLQTLAEKSGHKPIAGGSVPQYARVLDRYVSRLVELRRVPAALALLRKQIDSNPDDAGLYERLALFVEQNHMDNDLEQTYRAALLHFKDTSWASKLARVYLRRKRTAAYEALSRQIADTFQGSAIAAFLKDVPPDSPTLFRQVNLYAHSRFPHNMQFVKNMLRVYGTKATADPAAYDKLLNENWCNDPELETLYLEHLTRDRRLDSILASLPSRDEAIATKNTAALELRASAQTWKTDYEAAAPTLVELANLAPGDRYSNNRAIAIERSLAPSTAGAFEKAVLLARQDVSAAPADRQAIVKTGELLADREQFSQAKVWWDRAAAIHPGVSEGYLDAATVFWDYFQFDDALNRIARARSKLQNSALFAYQAGAIRESQGRPKEAVGEYVRAVLQENSEPAQKRLLTLARRPGTRDLVEAQTAALVTTSFDSQALELRIAILQAANRRPEIEALLAKSTASAHSTEETEALRAMANRLGFENVSVQALMKTVAITGDPIEKLSARLELARYYEAHGNAAAAEREYGALIADEPNRLGVLRAAVDHAWRSSDWSKAVVTLAAAADRAQQPYQNQLRREAAEKAAASGQYAEARRLLDRLLQDDQYDGNLLSEKASTYAREGDNAALTRFYSDTLTKMQAAPLSPADRTTRIAALRRGYILALTAGSHFGEALAQYQLIANAYPDDTALASEMTRYATARELDNQLVAYYDKAVKDAPRDYRWPLLLARIEATLGRLPEAVAAYDKAGTVRPDRQDIPLAKADLQLRLLRFRDVLKTYDKLYELSYHDRQYLGLQADVNARLGNWPEALRLLRAATIEPHPQEPNGFLAAMQQTNQWRAFTATNDLFQELRPLLNDRPEWVTRALELETEALTALHRTNEAVSLATAMLKEPGPLAAQMKAIAGSAAKYLTPDERTTFTSLPDDFLSAENAEVLGLRDLAAKKLNTIEFWQALDRLQTSRLLFGELGSELEALASAHRRDAKLFQQLQQQAFQAYAKEGNVAAQQRLLNYSGPEYARLFVEAGGDLNARIYDLAGRSSARANTVLSYLLSTAPAATVHTAIDGRGRRMGRLWTNSYAALAGLYLNEPAPWVEQAFTRVLGPRTVGASLNGPSLRDVLRGPDWFYYAGRFGAYLSGRQAAQADEYEMAPVEADPANPATYIAVGDEWFEANRWDAARKQYESALELNPKQAEAYDHLAAIEVRINHKEAALKFWQKALSILTARVEEGPLPPDYWTTAKAVLSHVNQSGEGGKLRGEVNALFETYIKRNGTYEVRPLLQGLLANSTERQDALNRVTEWARLPGAAGLLDELLDIPDLVTPSEKEPLYAGKVKLAKDAATSVYGDARVQAQSVVQQAELEYVRYLQQEGRSADAWSRLQAIQPVTDRPADLVLMTGALSGHLNELLTSYEQQPELVPAAEQMLSTAAALEKNHPELALQLEEFAYQREVKNGSDTAASYFGLARVRFRQKREKDGFALIRYVTLNIGAPFANLRSAAEVLESAGFKKEAGRYAAEWKTAEPWNAEAALMAGRLGSDAKAVDAVRRAESVEYVNRVAAARVLRAMGSTVNGSDELSVLTRAKISPADASLPFAADARIDAAHTSSDNKEKVRLYREAIAIDPQRNEARWWLALAAFQDHQDDFALSVFESAPRDPDAKEVADYRQCKLLAAAALGRRERFGEAASLYTELLAGAADGEEKARLVRAREEAVAKQSLMELNLRRRPAVTKDVTQHVLVRPKLTQLPAEEVATR